jgi:hypothetical protein
MAVLWYSWLVGQEQGTEYQMAENRWLTEANLSGNEREAAIYADGQEQAGIDRSNVVIDTRTGTWHRNSVPLLPESRAEREIWLRGYASVIGGGAE